eukprot:Pgem_evm1s8075
MVIFTAIIAVSVATLFIGMNKKKLLGLSGLVLFFALCMGAIVIGTQVGANYNANSKYDYFKISDYYNLGWSFWLMITAFVLVFVTMVGAGIAFVMAKEPVEQQESPAYQYPVAEQQYHVQATVNAGNSYEMKEKSDIIPPYSTQE